MQPTIRSQARLKRLVWLLSLLLVLIACAAGVEIVRLGDALESAAARLEYVRRELASARDAARTALSAQYAAAAKVQAVERAAEARRAELESKLKAAEAARAETEAKLNAVMDRQE
jgi:hypothetical protein